MLSLLWISLRFNLESHLANLPNLIAGALGMLVNNVLFLLGIWGMLFAGKDQNQEFVTYYIALNAQVMLVWGVINFFFGGWIDLGELIVDGQFESKICTPRHPLLLVATHSSHPSALGDLGMGVIGYFYLAATGNLELVLRMLLICVPVFFAFFALYIFAGSIAFFIPRGNLLGTLVREMTVSLSVYPMGKIFPAGLGRILLLTTPAATIAILPMDWVETANLKMYFQSVALTALAAMLSLSFFYQGRKRFQSLSVVSTQS